jgi:hypothetical protein
MSKWILIVIYDINIMLLITPPLSQAVFPVGSAGLGFAMIRPCTAKKIN